MKEISEKTLEGVVQAQQEKIVQLDGELRAAHAELTAARKVPQTIGLHEVPAGVDLVLLETRDRLQIVLELREVSRERVPNKLVRAMGVPARDCGDASMVIPPMPCRTYRLKSKERLPRGAWLFTYREVEEN